MQRSLTTSEQGAVGVLLLLMQEKIIPSEPWEVMKATPIKRVKRRFTGLVTEERNFLFECFYHYKIKITVRADRPKKKSSKAIGWFFKEAEIKIRPFFTDPWRTRKINFDQLRKMRSYRYGLEEWEREERDHRKDRHEDSMRMLFR